MHLVEDARQVLAPEAARTADAQVEVRVLRERRGDDALSSSASTIMCCASRPCAATSAVAPRGIAPQELVADVEHGVRPGALRQVLDDLAHALVAVDQDDVARAGDARRRLVEVVRQEAVVRSARLGEHARRGVEEPSCGASRPSMSDCTDSARAVRSRKCRTPRPGAARSGAASSRWYTRHRRDAAVARGARPLCGPGVRDHAAADAGRARHRLLPALPRAAIRPLEDAGGGARRRGARELGRSRLLRPRAEPPRGGAARRRPTRRRAAARRRRSSGGSRASGATPPAPSRASPSACRVPAVDTNAARVLARVFGVRGRTGAARASAGSGRSPSALVAARARGATGTRRSWTSARRSARRARRAARAARCARACALGAGLRRSDEAGVLQRYSATSTAPCAAPIRVLCDSATYLRPFGSAGSARRRPTLVAMPSSASRSRRGCGRNGSSCTMIGRRGRARQVEARVVAAEGAHRLDRGGRARTARSVSTVTASVWPSSTATRVQVAPTGAGCGAMPPSPSGRGSCPSRSRPSPLPSGCTGSRLSTMSSASTPGERPAPEMPCMEVMQHARDAERVDERLQRDDEPDGRAVRLREDEALPAAPAALVLDERQVRDQVDARERDRHVGLVAEGGGGAEHRARRARRRGSSSRAASLSTAVKTRSTLAGIEPARRPARAGRASRPAAPRGTTSGARRSASRIASP